MSEAAACQALSFEGKLMEITFWGAARAVTGSQHLIEVNGKRVLLDCGLFQGHRAEALARNSNLPFDPRSIDAVVLSPVSYTHLTLPTTPYV